MDAPVGVGHAISGAVQKLEEITRAKEEKWKRELEAVDLIGKHIKDYLEGGPDLETEDIELGRSIEVDLEVIRLRWKVVRKKREAKASQKNPQVQPSVGDSATVQPKSVEPVEQPKPIEQPTKVYKRRGFGGTAPKPTPKPDPQPVEDKKAAVEAKKAPARVDKLFNRGAVIGWPKEWPAAPLPPPNAQGFERLLYPRGLLGHAVQYVMDTSALPNRTLALAVSLSACAKGLDRKVIGPSSNSTILHELIIAETGAGKQQGLDCNRALLRAMGLEGCYAAGGLASVQSIEEIIEGREGIKDNVDPNPNALVVIDEVGGWLSRILSKGQTGNVSEIPSHLQTLWGLPVEGVWIGTKKVGKKMQSWHSVAFAILGFSTEKTFCLAIKNKLIHSGFINRMLYFNVGRGAEERIDPKYSWLDCPGWLVGAFQRVTGGLQAAPFDEPMRLLHPANPQVVLRDFHRLSWGPGVKEACRAYEKQIRGMPSVEDREFWIRTHDIALRLATIVAVYRCSAVVEIGDWQWAVEIAKRGTEQMKQSIDKHMLEELEDADLAEQIREYFRARKNQVVTIGTVCKHFERKANVRKLNEVIWHVEKTGDIEVVEVPPGPGRPTTYFRWRRSK